MCNIKTTSAISQEQIKGSRPSGCNNCPFNGICRKNKGNGNIGMKHVLTTQISYSDTARKTNGKCFSIADLAQSETT